MIRVVLYNIPDRSCLIRPWLSAGSTGRKSLNQEISGSGMPLAAQSIVAVRVLSTTFNWGPMSILGKPKGSRSSAQWHRKNTVRKHAEWVFIDSVWLMRYVQYSKTLQSCHVNHHQFYWSSKITTQILTWQLLILPVSITCKNEEQQNNCNVKKKKKLQDCIKYWNIY